MLDSRRCYAEWRNAGQLGYLDSVVDASLRRGTVRRWYGKGAMMKIKGLALTIAFLTMVLLLAADIAGSVDLWQWADTLMVQDLWTTITGV